MAKTKLKDLNSHGLLWAVTHSISAQARASAAQPLFTCLTL